MNTKIDLFDALTIVLAEYVLSHVPANWMQITSTSLILCSDETHFCLLGFGKKFDGCSRERQLPLPQANVSWGQQSAASTSSRLRHLPAS